MKPTDGANNGFESTPQAGTNTCSLFIQWPLLHSFIKQLALRSAEPFYNVPRIREPHLGSRVLFTFSEQSTHRFHDIIKRNKSTHTHFHQIFSKWGIVMLIIFLLFYAHHINHSTFALCDDLHKCTFYKRSIILLRICLYLPHDRLMYEKFYKHVQVSLHVIWEYLS